MAEQTLFGSYNPELIKQVIEAERESNLLAQARLTPQQIGLLGAARSGQQLGSALGGVVGGLFGNAPVQDPRLQQAQLGQQAYQEALDLSGGDASSPAFFKRLSSSAAKLGVTTLAQQAAQQAAKLESEQALGVQRIASAQASLAQAAKERAPEAPLTIADRARLNELVRQFGTDEGARRFRAERDEAERKKAAAGAPPQTPTEKAILPGKATQLGKVEESALQGAKTIQTADAIDRVLNTSFTGFGSDAKLRVGQIAEAFGATVTGTSETEQLKQLLAQLAQGQARTLPGALSEKELAFLREAIGTGNFTLNTLRNVTKRLRTDALAAEIENQSAQEYISGGGDLNKFNFVDNRKKAINQAQSQLSEREAKQRRIEELRKKQGGQ
jgi:hypothetical protein